MTDLPPHTVDLSRVKPEVLKTMEKARRHVQVPEGLEGSLDWALAKVATNPNLRPPPTRQTPQQFASHATEMLERLDGFLVALAQCPIVRHAYAQAGVSQVMLYKWKNQNPHFAMLWDEMVQGPGTDALEDEATRRGYHGVDKPVYYKGEKVDVLKEYSDTLLIFMLKGRRPERYNPRQSVEMMGQGGGPVQFAGEVKVTFVKPDGTVRQEHGNGESGSEDT